MTDDGTTKPVAGAAPKGSISFQVRILRVTRSPSSPRKFPESNFMPNNMSALPRKFAPESGDRVRPSWSRYRATFSWSRSCNKTDIRLGSGADIRVSRAICRTTFDPQSPNRTSRTDRLRSQLVSDPSFRNAINLSPDILRRAKKARLGTAAHAGKTGPLLKLTFADSAHADLPMLTATR